MKLFPEVVPTELLPALEHPALAVEHHCVSRPLAPLWVYLCRRTPDPPIARDIYSGGSLVTSLRIPGIKGRP